MKNLIKQYIHCSRQCGVNNMLLSEAAVNICENAQDIFNKHLLWEQASIGKFHPWYQSPPQTTTAPLNV